MEKFKSESFYRGVLAAIFALSILLQLNLFLKNPSFWHDEAALALNLFDRSYVELFRGLDNMQAVPPGFMILSKLMFFPQNDYMRDLCLRIIPFCFGILSLPAFYLLSKQVFKNNKFQILFSNLIFALNPCAILYSSQYKQYSLELFVSIILLSVFYNIINDRFRKYYYFLIFIAPFFSYSSIFVLVSGCILSGKNWLKTFIPAFAGVVLLYFVNLRYAFNINYAGMDSFYSDFYSFVSFTKPVRMLVRFSELFVTYKFKYLSLFTGLLLSAALLYSIFLKKINWKEKLLFLLPILGVILASSLHKYPVQARLILFLLPNFAILITYSARWTKAVIGFVFVYGFFTYTIYAPWLAYSYARDLTVTTDDTIILDKGGYEYKYYLKNKGLKNEILTIPDFCYGDSKICKDFVKNLPAGNYYLFTTGYGADKIVKAANVSYGVLFDPCFIKAVYMIKY